MDNLRVENTIFPREWALQLGGKLFTIDRPTVMGIVNCTPDSFVPSSRDFDLDRQIATLEKHIEAGATWLDLGAYSSRPGATDISIQEEIDRLGPVLEYIKQHHPEMLLSVDTFRSKVAEFALKQSSVVINDITAGLGDSNMLPLIANYKVPVILMHMRGNPQTMQLNTNYENLFKEIYTYFSERIAAAKQAGIKDIILDPGFGFAKTSSQNFELLSQLNLLSGLKHPVLAGLSRKSMIYKTLNITPDEALNGTTALHMVALQQGAKILRVHDVHAAKEVVELFLTLQNH